MKIFYVHHANRKIDGEPTQDDSLTKIGEKDAKNIAKTFEKLKDKYDIKAIYTSRFFRCKKTSQIINKKLNVPVYEDCRLDEFKSVVKETWAECQKRIISLLKEIVYKYNENDTVLCVTSGVNLTAFVVVAYNLQPDEFLPFPIVTSCSPIGFEISKNDFNRFCKV